MTQSMTWHEKIAIWKRRLPPVLWAAMIENGRTLPCICTGRPDLLCWRCISISERSEDQ
jgi:hypothetical protein